MSSSWLIEASEEETNLPDKEPMISNVMIRRPACTLLVSMGFIFSLAQTASAPRADLAPYSETVPNSAVKIQMVVIPGGNYKSGDKTVEVKPFYMAKLETPWEALDQFLASGPPSKPYDQTEFGPDAIARPSKGYILPDLSWGHNGYPVINISHETAQMFCRWLSKETGKKYRLPTEAEWEIAARGGEAGDAKLSKADAEKIAWFKDNSKEQTQPVGKKAANKFGLHDIVGNVGEWAIGLDGEPVICGGTFLDTADKLVPTARQKWAPEWQQNDPQMPKSRWWYSDGPFCGFRIVCEP